MQSCAALHVDPLSHLLERHELPQSTSLSFPFLTPSVQVGTMIDDLKFFTLRTTVLTLTNILSTNTADAFVGIKTTHAIGAFFLRCTPSTTIHITLISILDAIITGGNYNIQAQIICITNNYNHLGKYLICKRR
jgi:hypothetical protein